MRVNTLKSIRTANSVYDRYGSWKAARAASTQRDGKFMVTGKSLKRKERGSTSNDAESSLGSKAE